MDRGASGATGHGVTKESDMTWQLNSNNNKAHVKCAIIDQGYMLETADTEHFNQC